jgi:hypothetical protein
MALNPNKRRVTLDFEPEVIDRLDKYASKLGISRQRLVFNLIDTGMDDLAIMDSVGLLLAGKGFRKARNMVMRKFDWDEEENTLFDT